ncbi:DUF3817 domain-containing protein [Paenibacillus sp. HB172176]|uniref:DUF3817 domain-containing protein n=1 Tax=Paenibacillus sp. HB172176 TaxID=2493690 RepID=UPI00143BE741|nr:DUF3817 domain-containing protein [Paenibacillus sp. HB172176]
MLKSTIGRFRFISILEGLSFLVLLLIAMPLKYAADEPEMVTIVGSLHGLFFVLYMIALGLVVISHRWGIKKIFLAFIAAFLPFGPFVLDRKILKRAE